MLRAIKRVKHSLSEWVPSAFGFEGSGAPRENRNGLKHGLFTLVEQERRRAVMDLMRKARATLREVE